MWNRRKVLGSMAAMVSSAVATGQAAAQPTGPAGMAMGDMEPGKMTLQSCIESCWRSHVMCIETERYCLEKGGMHVMPAHLLLLADCAEMCQTTANSLLRRSPEHAAVCAACARLCDACAEACETMKDDERMVTCARTCRACAVHCREMSKSPI